MAFYKQDIVDINLNTGNIFRSFLNHSIGFKNDDADRFGIRVFRDGEPVDLTGASCQAVFINPLGTNIALTSYGTVSGNVAYVTLPQACYDYEGQFTLSIQLVGGGVTGTMRIVDGMVVNTGASGTVAPTGTVPTYQEVLAVYDQMVAAKEGSVRFDIDQSLTAAQKTRARDNVEAASKGDVDDLRSALGNVPSGKTAQGQIDAITGGIGNTTLPTTAQTITGAINEHEQDINGLRADFEDEAEVQDILETKMVNAESDIDDLQAATSNLTTRKVNQPLDNNNQPTNGTSGQVLRTNGDGSTAWVNVGLPTDEQTEEAITDWLNDHPEATTTVQDGSLTVAKFSNALKLLTIKDFVTPQMFGAKADGVTDDTLAFQAAIDKAEEIKESDPYKLECGLGAGIVFLPEGKYLITSSLKINANGLMIIGSGRHASQLITDSDITFIKNKDIYTYRQRVVLQDFSINFKGHDCIGIDFTSIGQSMIERVAIYGDDGVNDRYGTGIILQTVYNESISTEMAGHLNYLENCIAQHLVTGVRIIGGTNGNMLVGCEIHQNTTAVSLEESEDGRVGVGSANVIQMCRLETCTTGVKNGLSYTRIAFNYFDALSVGVEILAEGKITMMFGNHYAPSVTTRISNSYTDRPHSILEVETSSANAEQFILANNGRMFGVAGTVGPRFDGGRAIFLSGLQSNESIDCNKHLWFGALADNPTSNNVLFRNSDNELCYKDNSGNVYVIGYKDPSVVEHAIIDFINDARIYTNPNQNYLRFMNKPIRVDEDADFISEIQVGNAIKFYNPLAEAPSTRMVLYRSSDNKLCFVDASGNVKTVTYDEDVVKIAYEDYQYSNSATSGNTVGELIASLNATIDITKTGYRPIGVILKDYTSSNYNINFMFTYDSVMLARHYAAKADTSADTVKIRVAYIKL